MDVAISGCSIRVIAGMKNVAGTCRRSSRSKIRGNPVVSPYAPTDNGTGRGLFLCNNSLSTSNERHTATRAPLGQTLGVNFLPILAVPTAWRICSSLEFVVMGGAFCARQTAGRHSSRNASTEELRRKDQDIV